MPPHSSTTPAAGSRPWISSQTSEPITPTLGMLVQPRPGGAHYPGGALEQTGHDPARFDRRLEGAPGHFAAERLEEPFAGLGDASDDHHDLGVEEVEHVGDPDAQVAGGVVHHFLGQPIAPAHRLEYRL